MKGGEDIEIQAIIVSIREVSTLQGKRRGSELVMFDCNDENKAYIGQIIEVDEVHIFTLREVPRGEYIVHRDVLE